MKYKTIEDIAQLKEHVYAKTNEIEALTRRLESIHNLIPVMSEKAKAEALAEALQIKADIASLRAFITKAKAEISKFYAPAQKVA